ERKRPRGFLTQIDAGEPLRRLSAVTTAFDIAGCRAGEPLRLQRRAAGIIETHSLDDVEESVRVVRRFHDALQRVTTRAVEQESFLLDRPRNARQPFAIGQMSGKILHFPQLDLGSGFLARGNVCSPRSVQLIARRARLQRLMTSLASCA